MFSNGKGFEPVPPRSMKVGLLPTPNHTGDNCSDLVINKSLTNAPGPRAGGFDLRGVM